MTIEKGTILRCVDAFGTSLTNGNLYVVRKTAKSGRFYLKGVPLSSYRIRHFEIVA